MIVVVGNPAAMRRTTSLEVDAGGPAVAIARSAVAQGSAVQLVGRVGDDPPGDAIVAALARWGIGHAALARVAGIATPVADEPSGPTDEIDPFGDDGTTGVRETRPGVEAGTELDAGDLDLALRYLGSFTAIVLTGGLSGDAFRAAFDAVGYAGAALVVVREPGAGALDAPADALILEAPPAPDDDASFASLVGRLAAALDRGIAPRDAFEAALSGSPI
ncbi:MAG: PfkB family carbohydrate kinase [Candidatus Limnocylindrales bacterium]